MVNGIDRPLDLLNNSKGQEVLVQLKGDKQLVGTLIAFDIHINLVLDNTKEMQNGEISRRSFVKKMLAMGISFSAINLFLSGAG